MRVVGVIDLMGGVAVRGVAGRRAEYRPLAGDATPGAVARRLIKTFSLQELYLADLDAIGGAPPAWAAYDAIRATGVKLWIDAGVRTFEDGMKLAEMATVVAGLETVADLDVVERLAAELGERLVFSLDLRGGTPLAWDADAFAIAEAVIARGVRRLLVLDLARVGVGGGTGTEALCGRLATAHPDVEVSAGGGVRGRDDLLRLRDLGVRAALVASALHDGRLTRDDLEL